MNVMLGGTNTAVLICSSLTMALAVRSAQLSNGRHLMLFLVLTMIFGTVFLVIKGLNGTRNGWSIGAWIYFRYPEHRSTRRTRRSCSSCTSA